MTGTLFGLVSLFVGLALVTVALWVLVGAWGVLAAGGLWLAVGVVMVRPEVLYAGAT